MIKLKDIGNFETVPKIAEDIINGNISNLELHLKSGWDIEKEIVISKYIDLSPIDCALIMENFESVKWLVEHGVNLNKKDNPAFLKAVRYCNEKIIRYLVENGAAVNGVNAVKSEAFQEALYGNRYTNLPLIHELGHRVEKYGGKAFRSSVAKRDYKALKFFIKHGVDINYQNADQVYPFKPTPLCVAALYTDLKMCKFLTESGADVTRKDKYGMRPYSIALEKGDLKMAEYFKSSEPKEYHSLQNKMDELKPYKLPAVLIDFLQSDTLSFQLENCDFKSIDFFSLTDTIPLKIGKQNLLRISKSVGDYRHIHILWNPESSQIAYYDMEHEEFANICKAEDFIKDTSLYLQKILDGEFI
ncbi:ankyrin repeat domain-containing protein [Treponema pedis]|uniref:ankyrin repeat domain-containing protein n=1 Tax=Treponema pedis TaxID=409322 RepID=UPI00041A8855|nr:ankyrin repeat domain-containing protein [Treponema pedis]